MGNIRRYDLDWLRILVFALLIFYHVGMFFVPWGWHVKNNVISEDMRWPMLFVNQWRLSILFVISGMGTYFALGFRSKKQYITERVKRLFIPLLVGMVIVVPPQVYVERLLDGRFSGGYFQFWPTQIFNGIYPEGNFSWHHLWFLPYLLIFSIVLSPIFVNLRSNPDSIFLKKTQAIVKSKWGIWLVVIPLFLFEGLLEPFFPVTHALVGDWFTITTDITLFFVGFMLMSVKEVWFDKIDQIKQKCLLLGIATFVIYVYLILLDDSTVKHFIEAFVKSINMWCWIIVIFGYGAHYLNKSTNYLTYWNKAVYPFYIIHQTITVVVGYLIMDMDWHISIKFVLLSVVTFFGAWVFYEVVRKSKWLRPLFGLK